MDKSDSYTVAESPFRDALESCFQGIVDVAGRLQDAEDRRAVENALYFSVTKRIGVRDYSGVPADYLSGLLADLYDAQNEFEQVCYDNPSASDAFHTINGTIVSLLSNT